MTPLLSVVIPTFRRPDYLGRALASALTSAPDGDVEVVVVPNGPDDSWKPVASAWAHERRISWHYLDVGHASAARNHGLRTARGKYVRFLDDDDYLYPAAAEQLSLIESRRADLCCAPLENVRPDGTAESKFRLPDSDDFPTVALLSIAISGLTQGSIFNRSFIQNVSWRQDVALYDDYLWMLGLAEVRELTWFQTPETVGAYVQHDRSRLSRILRSEINSRPLVGAILQLHNKLASTHRLSPMREHATAAALLTHAHSAFPSSPLFLSETVRRAQRIDPAATPIQQIFHDFPWLARNLLVTEWALVAPRLLSRNYRRLSWIAKGKLTQASAAT